MIPRISALGQTPSWQIELAQAIRSPKALFETLSLPLDSLPAALRAQEYFALRVPMSYVRRMRPGDINDPLLRQILPVSDELDVVSGYLPDPVGDLAAQPLPGVLHKYHGRVLLIATGACAVHCRYCFRRHFPYNSANASLNHWQNALDYIRADASIHEVILSGGDPLSLSDHKLAELVAHLDRIEHVETLRIHTRLPVVIPSRIDEDLTQWLGATRLNRVMVIHVNHPNEIDNSLKKSILNLKTLGIHMLNQSVLLKGVNDDAKVLSELSHRLLDAGVMPYYLHMLDKVQGAAHFAVSKASATDLLRQLRLRLPGYLVPRLVEEIAGEHYKLPVTNHAS